MAIDIEDHAKWHDVLLKFGWVWRGQADPPHFNYHGPSDPDVGHYGIKAFQALWNRHNPTDLIKVDGAFGPNTERRLHASPIEGFTV